MGCISSSNNRKKYLEDSPEHLQENMPPENDKLSKKTSTKTIKDPAQLKNTSKSISTEKKLKLVSSETQKLHLQVQENKIRKLSGQSSENASHKTTCRQNNKKEMISNSNAPTKGRMKTVREQQDVMNRQEERILQILKRSQKISKIYRKVCSKMMQHNQQHV